MLKDELEKASKEVGMPYLRYCPGIVPKELRITMINLRCSDLDSKLAYCYLNQLSHLHCATVIKRQKGLST
jgi:hypothetical protein